MMNPLELMSDQDFEHQLDLYDISPNTRQLLHNEAIDAEALGLLMLEDRPWLENQLGLFNPDYASLVQLWDSVQPDPEWFIFDTPPSTPRELLPPPFPRRGDAPDRFLDTTNIVRNLEQEINDAYDMRQDYDYHLCQPTMLPGTFRLASEVVGGWR